MTVTEMTKRERADGRVPPHNLDAEEALLGAMLLSRDSIEKAVGEGVTGAAFYRPAHGTIYDGIVRLHAEGAPVDVVTVAAHLEARHELEAIGGPSVLLHIQAGTPATSNAHRYARIIAEHYRLRQGIANLGSAVEALYQFDEAGALLHIQRATEATDTAGTSTSSWQPVDLAQVLADGTDEPPTLLLRSDGQRLLYPGKVHAFNAESESGKTMIALQACAEQVWQNQHVIYIDFEDGPKGIAERLLGMEVALADMIDRFHYIRPDDPLDLGAFAHLSKLLEDHQPTLCVIDGVTEAMTLNQWSLLDNEDIARFYAALPKRIARAGTAVVLIDHVPKKKDERGKGGIGGQHKRAGIDGVSYNLEVVRPFARGLDGEVRLTVDKDRGGYIRAASVHGEHAATIRILSADGPLAVHIDAPDRTSADAGEWHGPTRCMEAVRQFFHDNPGEKLSKNKVGELLRARGISYRDAVIGVALEQLAVDHVLEVSAGPRNARLFQLTPSEGNPGGLDF